MTRKEAKHVQKAKRKLEPGNT